METESKDLMAPQTGDPRRQILYSFYNKPMAAKTLMLTTSAIQENTKVATVSEEIHRRLKRSLMALSRSHVEEILLDYMDDLEAMVYSVEWRRRVLKSSLLGYRRILEKARLGKTQRKWLGHETCLKRRVKIFLVNLPASIKLGKQRKLGQGENLKC